jgi:hypothetical protein
VRPGRPSLIVALAVAGAAAAARAQPTPAVGEPIPTATAPPTATPVAADIAATSMLDWLGDRPRDRHCSVIPDGSFADDP